MSELKCPFCNSELDMDMCGECGCPNEQCQKSVFMFGSEELWQELIRTRKALDVAVGALKRIKFRGEHSKYECCKVSGIIAQDAIKAITALEQKDK